MKFRAVTARAVTVRGVTAVDLSRSSGHNGEMEFVVSLFPGVDLLGRAFSARGFCVVRGPDLILDERIEDFHLPAGHVDGVIGGPPCQNYSTANRTRNRDEGDRLVLEFLRCLDESRPKWWLMENVPNVPTVAVEGYHVQRLDLTDWECGGTQQRLRHIQFGSMDGSIIRPARTNRGRRVTRAAAAVLCRQAQHERHSRRVATQGAPALPLRAFTRTARAKLIGNAVSLPMALVLAAAVLSRGPVTSRDCVCLCGRVTANSKQTLATAACRKRMQRRRDGGTRTISRGSPSHSEPGSVGPVTPPAESHVASQSHGREVRGVTARLSRDPRGTGTEPA